MAKGILQFVREALKLEIFKCLIVLRYNFFSPTKRLQIGLHLLLRLCFMYGWSCEVLALHFYCPTWVMPTCSHERMIQKKNIYTYISILGLTDEMHCVFCKNTQCTITEKGIVGHVDVCLCSWIIYNNSNKMLHMCHKCIHAQTMWQSGLAALVDQTPGILQSALKKETQLHKVKPETHAKFLL